MGAARSVLLLGCGALAGAWACAPSRRWRAGARRPQPEAGAAQTRLDRLRHDVRGALSPALLSADRLLANSDPAIRHAGEIIVKAIERATAILDATRSPPAGAPSDSASDSG